MRSQVDLADQHHGIDLQAAQLAHPHARAGQELDRQAQKRTGLGPGGSHEQSEGGVV